MHASPRRVTACKPRASPRALGTRAMGSQTLRRRKPQSRLSRATIARERSCRFCQKGTSRQSVFRKAINSLRSAVERSRPNLCPLIARVVVPGGHHPPGTWLSFRRSGSNISSRLGWVIPALRSHNVPALRQRAMFIDRPIAQGPSPPSRGQCL